MKLSNETISLLNNFSSINSNMLFKPGTKIATMADTRNLFAEADITEDFGQEFAIYDLKEFLSAIDLINDGDIEVDSSGNFVNVHNKQTSIVYYTTDKENITVPPAKGIKMPDPDVTFVLSPENVSAMRKAAGVLGHANVSIVGNAGVIKLSVYDKKESTSNRFDIVIDENNDCKESFEFVLIIGDLKIISGNYKVELSSKLITKFTNQDIPVCYWIAAEKTSTFGE